MSITPTSITLNDLAIVINIIDTCTERGSFKGPELITVGSIREKFASFIRENQKNEPKDNIQELEDNAE